VFSAFEWMVATRFLRARRQEGFISVIAWFSLMGIALGVATLIIVMAVMNGFREELLSRILGLNGHLGVYGTGPTLSDFDRMAGKVRSIPGVLSASPVIEGQVMATTPADARGVIVRGIRPADIRSRRLMADSINAGSMSDFRGDRAVAIGARLADRLGLAVGDSITLVAPKGNVTAFGTVPRVRSYRVVATFNLGMYEYDSTFVFMPLNAAQTYFKMPGAATNLEVLLTKPEHASRIGREIRDTLGDAVRLRDWRQANASFFEAVQVQRNVLFLILTLIILVAAFNIISGLITLVSDKGRDIAILRTMGATRGMIMRIFFISGASVGVFGCLAGFVLGVSFASKIETIRQAIQNLTGTELFAKDLYFLSHLPAKVDPTDVAAVVLMALGLSLLATLYPSWRAARIEPAEALRNG
jgi:lipoprotein-releasing system permease protein